MKSAKKLLPGFTLELYDPNGYSILVDYLMAGPKPARESKEDMKKHKVKKPAPWIKLGALANYHAMIGGPVTSEVTVRDTPFQPYPDQDWVVFVDGVPGYVACAALSKRED